VAALVTLFAVLAGGLAAAGNPVTRIRHTWHSFKGGYATRTAGSRLVSGLGSNRYDFYRVALDEFRAHPALGIGADNFQQQYLAIGTSNETPHYPHSLELRTLAQTGLIGVLLAVAGLGAALLAAGRSLRRGDPLARAGGGGGAGRVRILGGARIFRLVLGVRGAGRSRVCPARPGLCPHARGCASRRRCGAVTANPGPAHASCAAPDRLARCAGRRSLAGRPLAEPAGGPGRGPHLDEGSRSRLLAPG